ncbi:ribonuclease HII [Methanococcoides sp. SA1]|nr:ribonuclease HII [Methanococcoides sp. SA1]
MTKLLGIDDAGRGPVIGPMTLAGVIIDEQDYPKIKALNARDSKLLTPLQRRTIAEQLTPNFTHHIVTSSPKQIDDHKNLNTLEAEKTANIINYLTKDLDEKTRVIVDCPSVNIESWSKDVKELLENPENIILSCEHKADRDHPIVGAASILAKEKREEEIYKLKLKHKIDFGSGYPADPKTKNFLTENFDKEEYSSIIRFSWNTIKKLQKAKTSSQKKLF